MRHVVVFFAAFGSVLSLRADDPAGARHDFHVGQYVILVKDTPVEGRLPGGATIAVIQRGTEVIIERVERDRIVVRDGWKSEWVEPEAVVTRNEAIEYFTKAIQENPTADDYQNRAARYFFEDEYNKGIADLERAIQFDPTLPNPHYWLGRDRLEMGDLDVALDHFNTLVRLDPTSGNAYAVRAEIWLKRGEWTKALADYSEAVRVSPSASRHRQRLAWLLATCPDGVIRDGKKALELALDTWRGDNWNDPENAETVAAAFAETGNFERAKAFIESAMLLEPDDDDVRRRKMLQVFRQREPWRDDLRESNEP